jgi:hypothetical protein
MLMALDRTRDSTAGLTGPNRNREELISRTAKFEVTDDASPLEFVTTTSTVAIDESSKRAIRKQASRYAYRAKSQPSQNGTNPATTARRIPKAAAGGQIHRFRLGPQGLKHTPNQPPQVSENFTIVSLKSEELPATEPVLQASTSKGGVLGFKQRFPYSKVNIVENDEEDEPVEESSSSSMFSKVGGFYEHPGPLDPIRKGREQQQTWLEPLLFSRGGSFFGPSSGAMDPFNAMALPITPREQILLRYYCKSHHSFA